MSVSIAVGQFLLTLGTGFLSALTPFINMEAALLASQSLYGRTPWPVLAIAAAAGQMAAKSIYFVVGHEGLGRRDVRRAARHRAGRSLVRKEQARWLQSLKSWSKVVLASGRGRGMLVVAASSFLGLPPLLFVSVAAGLARMRVWDFLIVGFLGRFARFAVLILGAGEVFGRLHW